MLNVEINGPPRAKKDHVFTAVSEQPAQSQSDQDIRYPPIESLKRGINIDEQNTHL